MIKLTKLKEECGVIGIYSTAAVNFRSLIYTAMMSLQHRGEDSAGISISSYGTIKNYKSIGNTNDLFNKINDLSLKGTSCISHVRYTTFGDNVIDNAQPISSDDNTLSIAHNGNIYNSQQLKKKLMDNGIKFNTTSDTEVILNLFKCNKQLNLKNRIIESVKRLKGAFAIVMLINDKLVGIRDPYGIRPLFLGKLNSSYILSSETCTFDVIGADYIREIKAGEIIIIDDNDIQSINYAHKNPALCAFEYIYFSRTDSKLNNKNLYEVRENLGKCLASKYHIEADVVIGVPDSGVPSAIGYAHASGITYKLGFTKNNYVGRTFIKPTQLKRQKYLNIKLNIIKEAVINKKVIVVDDSIVRGTTSKAIVRSLKKAGAKEVHLLISSPKIDYTCNLGVNISTKEELLSYKKCINEMKAFLDVNTLGFLDINDLYKTFETKSICTGCFNGIYPKQ